MIDVARLISDARAVNVIKTVECKGIIQPDVYS